jgi:hypothetical protein
MRDVSVSPPAAVVTLFINREEQSSREEQGTGAYQAPLCSEEFFMQENCEPMALNEHLTDAEITWAIHYLDPDLCAERIGKDAGTFVGICLILLIGFAAYICLYVRTF